MREGANDEINEEENSNKNSDFNNPEEVKKDAEEVKKDAEEVKKEADEVMKEAEEVKKEAVEGIKEAAEVKKEAEEVKKEAEEQKETVKNYELDFEDEDLKRMRQQAISFQFTELHEVSFNDYLYRKLEQQEKCKLRTEIDADVQLWKKNMTQFGQITGMNVEL